VKKELEGLCSEHRRRADLAPTDDAEGLHAVAPEQRVKIGHRVATRPYSSGGASLLVDNHKRVVPQVNELVAVRSKQLIGYI
jgi:hypothetical protein